MKVLWSLFILLSTHSMASADYLLIDDFQQKAEKWLEEAIKAARRNGMRLELARSYVLYAEFFKRAGDLPKSKEKLAIKSTNP